MRAVRVSIGIALVAIALGGCKKASVDEWFGTTSAPGHGRYAGIGIYGPGKAWTRIVSAQQKGETPAAQMIDDQVIIAVVDSKTGEVRSCGDLTGYCIGMNPWNTPLAASQLSPINLTEHVKPDTPDLAAAEPAKPRPHARHRRPKVAQDAEAQ